MNAQKELTAKELAILARLDRAQGQAVSRGEIAKDVFDLDIANSNVVDVHIGNIRKKLGHGVIETVRGIGYKTIERGEIADTHTA